MVYMFAAMAIAFTILFAVSLTPSEWAKLGGKFGKLILLCFWIAFLTVLAPCAYIYGTNYYKLVIIEKMPKSTFKQLYPYYGWGHMKVLYTEVQNKIGWAIYRWKN